MHLVVVGCKPYKDNNRSLACITVVFQTSPVLVEPVAAQSHLGQVHSFMHLVKAFWGVFYFDLLYHTPERNLAKTRPNACSLFQNLLLGEHKMEQTLLCSRIDRVFSMLFSTT